MNKPKSKSASAASGPRLGGSVIVRAPFFAKPTTGICIAVYEDEPTEIGVQAFPLGREPLQIPTVPFFDSEPDAGVRSAAWPA